MIIVSFIIKLDVMFSILVVIKPYDILNTTVALVIHPCANTIHLLILVVLLTFILLTNYLSILSDQFTGET